MRRVLFASSLLAITMLAIASTALARGGGWQSAGMPPSFTTQCGSTPVTVTPIAFKVFIRLLKQQADGVGAHEKCRGLIVKSAEVLGAVNGL